MKILFSAVLSILFVTAVLGQDDTTTTIVTPTTTVAPTTSTTTEITTSTSVETSTAQPTTSTEPPTPTTQPTTTSSTSSTTQATTSTTSSTTSVPSTTKAPKPTAPVPEECSWNVTNNNVTCIRVEMKAIFTILIDGTVQYVALTPNATTNQQLSTCNLSNDTQRIVIFEPDYTLTMIFAKESDKVFVNDTTFDYTIPQGTGSASNDSKLFTVKAGNSYMCRTQFNLQMGNVTMEVYDLHIQAFGETGNTGFGSAEECEADDKVSDAVPIAVGCALAALIIIVLIAYLVGRRQSRQRGYQSV